ncbi:conserved Plasmodium protein, unknown function [Plasmodium berghei]|uniref:Uncharacterized protein n=2 Tax=Plasmodium berghei TaxID=5821 RepID=A0A509APS1_PLABA|nr:conserved Plasmodium protein, unknown function [Plasmodium berghei ANKA]CXI66511.1 conserved Plasmodium protein, unknown function [Plasmodium berghei]SCM24044.1 conserved Plasmodium protein, unknown function [Plasmodium berghei]SCN26898.1 conserved Plasmodium protein, unknown function [Plasmodium berghei]SCO61315.1 conserved Plasmodium protein, unknown function [Plasmodium berghei]SCO63319.1 conserved Plasmodium protein, unknown function [Plasmodium berghei]|eukprot:XP_034422514.1 conserved Plasmodium protein, unknown function [Plasmodium berghei ANKA]
MKNVNHKYIWDEKYINENKSKTNMKNKNVKNNDKDHNNCEYNGEDKQDSTINCKSINNRGMNNKYSNNPFSKYNHDNIKNIKENNDMLFENKSHTYYTPKGKNSKFNINSNVNNHKHASSINNHIPNIMRNKKNEPFEKREVFKKSSEKTNIYKNPYHYKTNQQSYNNWKKNNGNRNGNGKDANLQGNKYDEINDLYFDIHSKTSSNYKQKLSPNLNLHTTNEGDNDTVISTNENNIYRVTLKVFENDEEKVLLLNHIKRLEYQNSIFLKNMLNMYYTCVDYIKMQDEKIKKKDQIINFKNQVIMKLKKKKMNYDGTTDISNNFNDNQNGLI